MDALLEELKLFKVKTDKSNKVDDQIIQAKE
jgi:hypothetical protein